jgi:hypothetical protein
MDDFKKWWLTLPSINYSDISPKAAAKGAAWITWQHSQVEIKRLRGQVIEKDRVIKEINAAVIDAYQQGIY